MLRTLTRLGFVALAPILLALAVGCSSKSDQIEREKQQLRQDREREMQDLPGSTKPKQPAKGGTVNPGPPSASPVSAPAGPRPGWVISGASPDFPRADYITGAGSCRKGGDSAHAAQTAADDRARANLAKTIRVHIRSEFATVASLVTEARGRQVTKEEETSSTLDRIASQTDLVLDGAQIVGRWYDAAEDTYWAFAALDRTATGLAILDRLGRLQQEMDRDRSLGTTYRQDGRPVQAAAYFNRAMKDSLTLLANRAQLRVIAPNLAEKLAPVADATMEPLWKDAALAMEELRVALVVFVQIDGRRTLTSGVETELARALRRLDLNIVQTAVEEKRSYADLRNRTASELREYVGGRANCIVLADFSAKQVAAQKLVNLTAYFYRARAEAAVIDLSAERVIASAAFDWSPETHIGNPDAPRAAQESLLQAAGLVAGQLKTELVQALNLVE